MWTPEKEARLAELESRYYGAAPQSQAAPAQPSMGLTQRFARHVGNIPAWFVNAGQSIGDTLLDTDTAPKQLFDIPQAQTAGERAVDVAGTLTQELAGLATGSGLLTKGARLLRAGKAAPIIGDTATGAISGLRESGAESGLQAGEFGASGAILSALGSRSPIARALIGGAANLGVGVAGQAIRGNELDSPEALGQMATLALFPAAQEAIGAAGRRLFRRAEPPAISANVDEVIPPGGNQPLALEGRRLMLGGPSAYGQSATDVRFRQVGGPYTPTPDVIPMGHSEPLMLEAPGSASPVKRAAYEEPVILESQSRPQENIVDAPFFIEPTIGTQSLANRISDETARIAAMTPEQRMALGLVGGAQRRLFRPLQGGESGHINPHLLGTLGGATGGALLDHEDPLRGAAVGAGLALGGMAGARLFRGGMGLAQRLAKPIADQDNMGAIRDPFPKWRSLWIDRSGNPRGTMRDQAHVELLKQGENPKSLLRARVQGDQLYLESTPASLTPAQRRFAQDFADEHGLSIQTNDRRTSLSPQPTGTAPALLRSGEPASPGGEGGRLKPLRGSQSGAVNPNLLGGMGGAVAGAVLNPDDPLKGAAIGAAGVLGIAKAGKFLRGPKLTDAADLQMQGKNSFTGSVARFAEKNLNYNKDELLKALDDRARGEGQHWANVAKTSMQNVGRLAYGEGLTAAHKRAGEAYIASKGDPTDLAALRRANVPPEYQRHLETIKDANKQMQRILMRAESDPRKQMLIANTLGDYQTRQFKFFLEDGFKLDDAQMAKAMQEWKQHPVFQGVDPAILDKVVKDDLVGHLREMGEHGGDYARMANEGKSRISKALFTKRKDLDNMPEYRKLLGEVSDPHEAQVLTTNKLLQSVTQAKLIGDIHAGALDSQGNRFAMSQKEWQDALSQATRAGDTAKVDFLTKRYVNAPDGPSLGALAGQKVQRQVADHLQFSGHQGLPSLNGTWYAALNAVPKTVFTRLNPATWVRNYGQAVLQGHALGIWDVTRIFKTAKRMANDPALKSQLIRSGVLGSHAGLHEFGQNATKLAAFENKGFRGKMKAVMDVINEGYGKPDQWIRATAYLDELEKNVAKGLSRDQAGLKALEFVNRYSHNYGQVNRAVGLLRNTPVVNPFISYSSEMARIIKNLATDVVTGNERMMGSAGALMSLLAMPAMLTYAAKELGLTEDQKKELTKVQELLPPYMRGKLNATYGQDQKGNFQSFQLQPWMPAGDFVSMARNILNADVEALSVNNPIASTSGTPLLNAYTELRTGKDLVTGQTTSPLEVAAKNTVPMFYRGGQLVKAFTPNEDGGYGLEEPSGRKITPANAIAGALGFGTNSVSKKRLLRRVEAEIQDEISQAKRTMSDVLRTNAAPQIKAAARAEFQEEKRRLLFRKREILSGVQSPR